MSVKMANINYNNFTNICRTCLSKCDLKFTQNPIILNVFHKLTDIRFETNAELPQQICLKCYEKINEFNAFSMQCIQTHSVLMTCFNNYQKNKNNPEIIIKEDPIKLKEEITIEEHKIEFTSDDDDDAEESHQTRKPETNINCFEEILLKPNTSDFKFENEDSSNENDSNKSPVTETPTPTKQKRTKRYTCDICHETLTHLKTFNKHMREHSGERPYKCQKCPMSYIDPFWLKRHVSSHTGDHQLKCDVCDKAFNEPSSLIKHKAAHSDERPFVCDVCHKTFKFAHNLMGHKKIHSGERPYECDVCPKAFTSSWNLLRHKRVHSGERPYKCDICDHCFVESNKLRKHIRKHHEQSNQIVYE